MIYRIGVMILAFSVGALVLVAATASAGPVAEVVLLDECDPATFNAVLGPGACLNVADGAQVKFLDFIASIPNPSWDNEPNKLTIEKGTTVIATNQGGGVHTFTEVANFGGGFVPALNQGAPVAPECGGGFSTLTVAATRVIQGSHHEVTGLTEGLHKFQCCIHPWMHTEIQVNESD